MCFPTLDIEKEAPKFSLGSACILVLSEWAEFLAITWALFITMVLHTADVGLTKFWGVFSHDGANTNRLFSILRSVPLSK